jgi:hypothetical protein
MEQTPERYMVQYYESDESKLSPFASTPDDTMWRSEGPYNLSQAMLLGKNWTVGGLYKTCRVLELDERGIPKSVVWLSAWERPMQQETTGSTSSGGIAGQTIKIQVWRHRDHGPPDHWDWGVLDNYLNNVPNSWDLVYGRELDRRVKMVLWSIRINIYPGPDHRDVIDWPWYEVFGYTKKEKDRIEAIRAHEIEPRTFPEGVPKVDCVVCNRTVMRSEAWWAYVEGYEEDPEHPDSANSIAPCCSCRCIDNMYDYDAWRRAPSGEETEEPGCVWLLERIEAMV